MRLREDIETLAQIVRNGSSDVLPELVVPRRQMVTAVVIDPRQPGKPRRMTAFCPASSEATNIR